MKDIKSQKFETEQTLKINKQCNISNKTNPQKAINLLSGSAYLEGSFVNWKQKRTKLKIEFNGIYLSPGCRDVSCAVSGFGQMPCDLREKHFLAVATSALSPRSNSWEKNLWYPGYLRENLFIQTRTPSFTAMQKQPKKKFKGKKNPLMHKPNHLP